MTRQATVMSERPPAMLPRLLARTAALPPPSSFIQPLPRPRHSRDPAPAQLLHRGMQQIITGIAPAATGAGPPAPRLAGAMR